jgi:hypothetical protein
MKKTYFLFLAAIFCIANIFAQQSDAEYTRVLTERSEKIVKTLDIQDTAAFSRVTDILVKQYKNLGKIHDGLDADLKKLKADIKDKTLLDSITNLKKISVNEQLYNLHCAFLGELNAELAPEQIVKIKDGMTYGVVKVTYDSYCDMIPSLKAEEKRQLISWLAEAREHAMDASSSNKKHEWFGKYKGRFNNYLSARGYDITQERKAWEERLKAPKKVPNADLTKKAEEWVASLNITDSEKTARLKAVIVKHLAAVRDWHNEHPFTLVPEGINPKTGGVLSKTDRQIIADATIPKDIHTALMDGLRKDLTEEQVEQILDKYTVGKVDFTMKAYREIIPKMTKEAETTILNYLKQAREEAVDYKNMEQISAIFKIYKTKIELYLYQNDINWKTIYKKYVDELNKKKK